MQNTDTRTQIHSTALVDPSAQIGEGVRIGPYVVIGSSVCIGDGTRIDSHVVIDSNTTLGRNCSVMSGAMLGGAPQDYKYKGEDTYLRIGDGNVIREYVTIHRASGEEGETTTIGDDNMLMAYCHIGHNCSVGSNITMANYVGISGQVLVEDNVVFGGIVGVHQNVRIGKLAMVGGLSKVVQDVPPFAMADGRPARVCDLNVIGLRRNGVTSKVRSDLKRAYKLLYRSSLNNSQALEAIENELDPSDELQYLLDFMRNIRLGFGGRQLEAPRD